jgi:phosphohistidine phosphatase
MKTLLLMRHAKSSWDDPTLADFDRPLNPRGLRAAPAMGAFMRRGEILPERIFSSPAVRARETTRLVSEGGAFEAEIKLEDRIYEASANGLRQIAAEVDDACSCVMLVGHNPGMEHFVRHLTGEVVSMRTTALAVVDLDITKWAELDDGCGTLRALHDPKNIG